MQREFDTYIDINIPIKVIYTYQKEEQTTRHYPGHPSAISVDAVEIPKDLANYIDRYYRKTLEEMCWEDLADEKY